MRVFIAGGTGYMGRALVPHLLRAGHSVCVLCRPGSESRVPEGCSILTGDALDARSFASGLPETDVFVHLVGVPHPAPWKEAQFRAIDQRSLEASVEASHGRVAHFIYVSVAQPAPVMRMYQQIRAECERTIIRSGMSCTILRPWYVLGPGHWWPCALLPLYRLAESIPSMREGAGRLGLVTLHQMTDALVWSVENPATGVRVLDVPSIRTAVLRPDRAGTPSPPARLRRTHPRLPTR